MVFECTHLPRYNESKRIKGNHEAGHNKLLIRSHDHMTSLSLEIFIESSPMISRPVNADPAVAYDPDIDP